MKTTLPFIAVQSYFKGLCPSWTRILAATCLSGSVALGCGTSGVDADPPAVVSPTDEEPTPLPSSNEAPDAAPPARDRVDPGADAGEEAVDAGTDTDADADAEDSADASTADTDASTPDTDASTADTDADTDASTADTDASTTDAGVASDAGAIDIDASLDPGSSDAASDSGIAPECSDVTKLYQWNSTAPANPPYSGTNFVDPDIITASDPSAFVGLTSLGRAQRQMFDRRTNRFGMYDVYLFDARFGSSKHIEIEVNAEFTLHDAEVQANRYATVIGRLPSFLLRDVDTVWLHYGYYPFGGGNRNLLIHTLQGEEYDSRGVLEETLVHESSHTSVEGDHANNPAWLEAQTQDRGAISTYARDNLGREDIAETVLLYLAQKYRQDRVSPQVLTKVRRAVPNRLLYLDCQGWTMDIAK